MEKLKGKYLSVLGDSISTYYNVSNNPSYNKTIYANAVYYFNQLDLKDTYWSIILEKYQMKLCVNNSWSGGYVSPFVPNWEVGDNWKDCNAIARSNHLANNDGVKPDVILFFIGINDLNAGVDAVTIKDSFLKTLHNIKTNYPNAITFCLGYPNRKINGSDFVMQYNNALLDAIKENGKNFIYVDFYNSDVDDEKFSKNSFDGLHPNKEGMKDIARLFEQEIEKHFKEN